MMDHLTARSAIRPLPGPRCALGESPRWDARTETLYWVDISQGILHHYHFPTKRTSSISVGAPLGHCLLTRNPRVMLVSIGIAIYTLRPETGRREIVTELLAVPEMRINDGGIDPSGRLWFGTTRTDYRPGHAALYLLDADGGLQQVLGNVGISNGMAWVDSTFYYVDSVTRGVDSFPWSPGQVALTRRTQCLSTRPNMPDGMCRDRFGRIWIALFGGGRVICWDPTANAVVQVIQLPIALPTSCVFGGSEGRILFITSAIDHPGMPASVREDWSGHVFSVEFSTPMAPLQEHLWNPL